MLRGIAERALFRGYELEKGGEEGGTGHLDSWPQSEQALTGSRLHDGLILIMSWLEVCILEESCAVSMRSHSALNVRVVQTF